MAENNIWLRGAISSGKAYFNSKNSQVVGPAYINAYLLEERFAINPRVLIDNKLISELGLNSANMLIEKINNVSSCSTEYDLLERNVLFHWNHMNTPKEGLEKDVAIFVDYLVYALAEESKLMKIIDNIELSIYSDQSVYSKFKWVADYLSTCCRYHSARIDWGFDSDIINKQYFRLHNL